MTKYCVLLLLFCLLIIPQAAMSSTYLSWFTDANISESTSKLSTPTGAPPTDTNGTKGSCVNMTSTTFAGVTFAVPLMADTYRGMISFWIRPTENGKLTSGGSEHVLLAAGTPASNGLQVSWNNATGTLRFKMASSSRVTACRADISSWAANDWHHVQVAWKDVSDAPVGLAIWIDKVAVASCVYGGTSFMSPPSGNYVKLGSATSRCYMDELIFRDFDGVCENMISMAYHDYFRTAPYTAIQITNTPNQVASDTWVLAGKKKQFGLTATRLLNTTTGATTTEYLADFNKRYGPWGDFDAKPYISWSISGGTGTTIDGDGLVTGGSAAATRTLSASFAGLTAPNYSLEVRTWTGTGNTKADLCLKYVERLPRYERNAAKEWPATNDVVTTVAHIGNFGTASSGTYYVKCERYTDSNNNFKVDDSGTWTQIGNIISCASLANSSTSEKAVSWTWTWPSNGLTTGSYFIRVTVDCGSGGAGGTIAEICEANNVRTEKSNAKAFAWGRPSFFDSDYTNRVVNLVGSFSDYDWQNAEVDRVALLMREAVYPSTTANGILDSIRVDNYFSDPVQMENEIHYYDGGYGGCEPLGGAAQMDFDNAIGHEICHTTLGQPDLYGQWTNVDNCFVKDSNENYYSGTAIYPITWAFTSNAPYSGATFDYPDQLGVGYALIMDACHVGLMGRAMAGLTQLKRQAREDLIENFWGDFGIWVPTTNRLQLFDANDAPLANARVYVYQMICNGQWYQYGNRYYSDRPKFIMATDSSGYCTIPTSTCQYWDDYTTDDNDGSVAVLGPFGVEGENISSVPSGATGEVLLLRVVTSNTLPTPATAMEFHLLPMTEFNAAYFAGNTGTATYPIRTSLTSPASAPTIVAPKDPAGGQAPAAKISYDGITYESDSEIYVTAGTIVTLDGSVSTDPEGFTPLRYRWNDAEGIFGPYSSESSYSVDTTGWAVDDRYDIGLMVIDSVRYSNILTLTIVITPPDTVTTGRVTKTDGAGVAGAIVGFKATAQATADAITYAVTDSNGYYTITGPYSGSYKIAAYATGWSPCADSTVTAGGTCNLQLTQTVKTNRSLTATVACSSSNPSEPAANAKDGDSYTRWAQDNSATGTEWWYADFGTSRSIRGVTLEFDWAWPTAYVVQTTTGNPASPSTTWTTRYTTTSGNPFDTERSPSLYVNEIRFTSAVSCRAVRVYATGLYNNAITVWEIKANSN